MSISSDVNQLELEKFTENPSGFVSVKILAVSSTATLSDLKSNVSDNEKGKFVEDESGDCAVAFVI